MESGVGARSEGDLGPPILVAAAGVETTISTSWVSIFLSELPMAFSRAPRRRQYVIALKCFKASTPPQADGCHGSVLTRCLRKQIVFRW